MIEDINNKIKMTIKRRLYTFPRAMAMAANPMSPPFLMLELRLRAKSVPNTLISFWIWT